MNQFQALFGIEPNKIQTTCILLPFASKEILADFSLTKTLRGKLYGVSQTPYFSLIHTGMGPGLCGDAVLHLQDTQAENIILFGSCGLTKKIDNLDVASLVCPHSVYNLESFTRMLRETSKLNTYHPDKRLFEKLIAEHNGTIEKVRCATVGSLKLEEAYTDTFEKYNIQAVDMESSAFFSAAKHVNKKAVALFYVTDILGEKPFYRTLNNSDKTVLSSSIKSGASILCRFIKTHLVS